jgi:hypothetical protein
VLGVIATGAALATPSLLITDAIAFDPESWIVWAREIFGRGYRRPAAARRGGRCRGS